MPGSLGASASAVGTIRTIWRWRRQDWLCCKRGEWAGGASTLAPPAFPLLPELSNLLLYVDAHQAGEVTAEDFLLGLRGQLRIAVAGYEVLWQFKLPEGIQRPARVPDGGLTTIEDLVFAAPEHQLAHILGEGARGT